MQASGAVDVVQPPPYGNEKGDTQPPKAHEAEHKDMPFTAMRDPFFSRDTYCAEQEKPDKYKEEQVFNFFAKRGVWFDG